MKSLRDATVLLGLLLLLTSVKIGPVGGPANVVPLTEAGIVSTEPAREASNVFPAEVTETQLEHEFECTSSVIVIERDQEGGPLVLRVQAILPDLPDPAPEPVQSTEEPALWACDKG